MTKNKISIIQNLVKKSLIDRNLLPRDQRVLIAVSGGQDSTCLAHILKSLQSIWSWELFIAHCDHQWPHDEGIPTHVESLAKSLDIPFFCRKYSETIQQYQQHQQTYQVRNFQNRNSKIFHHCNPATATKSKSIPITSITKTTKTTSTATSAGFITASDVISQYLFPRSDFASEEEDSVYKKHNGLAINENSAREWRYNVLSQLAQEQSCSYLVTGHTLSDRAETILFNCMKGAGTDGLSSVRWTRTLQPHLQLVRPLLNVSRVQTWDYCNFYRLEFWDDLYNKPLKYNRNRIRRELIPYMEAHFNVKVQKALSQMAQIIEDEADFLNKEALRILTEARVPVAKKDSHIDDSHISRKLKLAPLASAHLAVQRKAIHIYLNDMGSIPPTFHHIENIISLLKQDIAKESKTFILRGGWTVRISSVPWACTAQGNLLPSEESEHILNLLNQIVQEPSS